MVTYLSSLVQLCCGEGGTLQTEFPGICGECSQVKDHTGFAKAQGGMCFLGLHCSGSREELSAGVLSKAGLPFWALHRSKPLRVLGIPQGHRVGWVCILCPSQVQAAQATRCFSRALAQVGCTS